MATLQCLDKVARCSPRWYLAVSGTDFEVGVPDLQHVIAVPGFQHEVAVSEVVAAEVGLAVHFAESSLFEGVV